MESIPSNKSPILIVDDDSGLLRSIRTCLLSVGLPEPALLSDSRRALELVREHHFQVVLIDLIMPHRPGFEVLSDIKKEFPEVECVVISAVDEISSGVEAVRLGACDYLVKPLHEEKLILTINRALERYRL